MARLRYNGLTATLGANLLTAGTTITFTAALTHAAGNVPTITGSDYIPLAILDADGDVVEIIHLTAYTSGATTGTVTRAQESTTAADRASGLRLVNGLTVADVTELAAGPASSFSGAVLTKSAVQSVTAATETAVTFDGEVRDTNGYHDNATNNTRLTAPASGTYLVGGSVEFEGIVDQKSVIVRIRKNGTNNNGDGRARLTSSAAGPVNGYPGPTFARVVQLNAGDYVELTAYHDDTVARNVRSSTDGTSFWIAALGGTATAAAEVSYAGSTNLAATNVEAALDELDAEKAPLSHSHAYGARIARTTAQSIPTATTTTVSWSSATWDDGPFWSAGTPTAITIPAGMGGRYMIVAQVVFAPNATGRRVARLEKGGSPIGRYDGGAVPGATAPTSFTFSTVASLAAGDSLALIVYQDSGGALDLDAASHPVYLHLHKLP